jgi:stage V sporulation protein SpoVS
MREDNNMTKILKVKKDTSVQALSGSIDACFTKECADNVKISAIGASAVSQATKGIARASVFSAQRARTLIAQIGFENVMIDGEERSVIVWNLSQK